MSFRAPTQHTRRDALRYCALRSGTPALVPRAWYTVPREPLNNSSFRRMPESRPLNLWIPAFAGMTEYELFRGSLVSRPSSLVSEVVIIGGQPETREAPDESR